MTQRLLATAITGALTLGTMAPVGATGVDFFYYDASGSLVDDSWGSWFADPVLSPDQQTFAWGTGGRSSIYLNDPSVDADGNTLSQFDTPPYMAYENDSGVIKSKVAESVSFDFNDQPTDPDRSWSVMGYVVHDNQTINESNTEPGLVDSTIDVQYNVDFYAPDDPGRANGPIYSLNDGNGLRFALEFWETLNNQDPNCDGANPLGSNCDDRFRYRLTGTDVFDSFVNTVIDTFEYENVLYDVTMTGFVCPVEGCIGDFYSAEGGSRLGVVLMDLHRVPAPGMLGLLGVGLISLMAFSRRRRA